MSSGCFILHLDIIYGCTSTHWPLSTKAELIAIWTAVLAIPMHINNVNIFTNSQAAIDGISKAKSSSWNERQYTKSPNSMIIEQILIITNTKSQVLNLVKIKGHSGDLFNDTADDIAKRATSTAHQDPSHILDIQYNTMYSRMKFKLFWKNMPWDGQVRANISTLAALPYCADWALSKSTSIWFDDNHNNS